MNLNDMQILNHRVKDNAFKDEESYMSYLNGSNKVIEELTPLLEKIEEISNTNNLSIKMPEKVKELKELWKNVR